MYPRVYAWASSDAIDAVQNKRLEGNAESQIQQTRATCVNGMGQSLSDSASHLQHHGRQLKTIEICFGTGLPSENSITSATMA